MESWPDEIGGGDPAHESDPSAAAAARPDVAASLWWLLLTPLLPGLGALPFVGPWLLPLAAPLTVYAAFCARVRARRYASAWAVTMLWALLLSAGAIALTELRPASTAVGILHGPDYREEMFRWIVTGAGKETTPARFVPEQLLHLALFLVLTVVSGGYLGLVLGAFLIGYMSYFVGSFARHSRPIAGALAAWVPWSVLRVAAFVLFCVVLARPLLMRGRSPASDQTAKPFFGARERWILVIAAGGVVLDLIAKVVLAPWWGHLLQGMLRR